MLGGALEDLAHVLDVRVHRAGDEGRLGRERHAQRVEGPVERPDGGGLGDLALLRGRGVLPLRQPVDPVVEEQDLEVDVAAQRVDEVVAADGQRVAVAGDDPHRQVRARYCQAGRNGRGAAVAESHGASRSATNWYVMPSRTKVEFERKRCTTDTCAPASDIATLHSVREW